MSGNLKIELREIARRIGNEWTSEQSELLVSNHSGVLLLAVRCDAPALNDVERKVREAIGYPVHA